MLFWDGMVKGRWKNFEERVRRKIFSRGAEVFNSAEVGKSLLSWLLDSGVCLWDPAHPACGGVHAGYDVRSRRWLFVYCEITGYAISMLCALHQATGEKSHLDAAKVSARFLLRHQTPANGGPAAGSFPEGLQVADLTPMPRHYSFDAAMCIQGLLDLYAITRDIDLLDASKAAGDWLLTMQDPSGFFLSKFDSETGLREHPGPFFHEDAGCLHAKHAIALLKLYSATKDERYERAARKVCDWVLSLQEEDGAFWANPTRSHVFAHAHCYATEGLLFACDQLGSSTYQAVVDRSCAWLEKAADKRYGILGTQKIAPGFSPSEARASHDVFGLFRRLHPRREIATDATVQAARLFLYRYLRGDDDQGAEKATRILHTLIPHVMYRGSLKNARGGLYARFDISLGFVRASPIIATWGILFAVQACLLLDAATKKEMSAGAVAILTRNLF